MEYFISDLHLGHYRCIQFDNRPFLDVNEMNEVIINNINNKCRPSDDLFILGDFCMNPALYSKFAPLIKCRKHLILGNHDNALEAEKTGSFVEVTDYKKLMLPHPVRKGGHVKVVLFHFPIASWDGQNYGAIHIYGHVHNNFVPGIDLKNLKNAYNAFCVNQGFMPFSLKDYIEKYGYDESFYIPPDKKESGNYYLH